MPDGAADRSILFVSSNGVGLGHLTRQMAVAERLPTGWHPTFMTMSYGASLLRAAGHLALFMPHHKALGIDQAEWNLHLEEELALAIRCARPQAVVYDATAIFSGFVEALARQSDLFSIWMRRPMWREVHRKFLALSDRFSVVIEPGELADEFDHGPTKEVRDNVVLVPPVLHLAPNERLERAEARAFLGVPDGMTVVALQLGSGNNFDMRGVRSAVLKALLDRPDTLVLDIRSPIRADFEPDEPLGPRHRIVELYPSFRYSRAFDAAVVAPGYNTFHENVLGAVPTLFVPNEADEMDLQLNRARWAEQSGLGLVMRRDHDIDKAGAVVERLLDAGERNIISKRCNAIAWTNGADVIARHIEEHARMAGGG
jgi:UDP:flavonoid glycosyltransferase YjiC (YdhE family)